MTLSIHFEEALIFATRLHAGQLRKGTGIPYIAHLLAVAGIVLDYGGTETEAIAALLHDAVEDQGGPPTREEIQRRFGAEVVAIVDGCSDTDQAPKPPWQARKETYLAGLSHESASVRLVSAADKLHNYRINLSPEPALDNDGRVRLMVLDNHAMGTMFEELIRRFNEENNEEAGEHFTPRDVVTLMAELIFRPIADAIKDGTYTVYDGACGTGGMLTVAEERLAQLASEHGKHVSVHLFGQEVQPETYAITKANLLLKGEGEEAENFVYGLTLSADGFPAREFDFMLSNPPYGKSWKTDLERMGGKGEMRDPRFVVAHPGVPDFSLITRSSDGQLMFLANKLAKMKQGTPLGSRIAEVHNGSSLFTGDAGQGESNIRRWIIENDWLINLLNEQKQAIVQEVVTRGLDANVPTYLIKKSGSGYTEATE